MSAGMAGEGISNNADSITVTFTKLGLLVANKGRSGKLGEILVMYLSELTQCYFCRWTCHRFTLFNVLVESLSGRRQAWRWQVQFTLARSRRELEAASSAT